LSIRGCCGITEIVSESLKVLSMCRGKALRGLTIKCPNLVALDLTGNEVSGTSLKEITNHCQLQSIVLKGCIKLPSDALSILGGSATGCTLQGLVISSWQSKVTTDMLNVLFQNLKNLKLFDASWTNSEENLVMQSSSVHTILMKGSSSVRVAIFCQKLYRLVIGSSSQLEEVLFNCPNIEKIDAAQCPLLTNKFTETIAWCCPVIKTINISGCNSITPQAITTLLHTSPCLNLSVGSHKNLSFLSIPQNQHLKFLSLRNCLSLRGLDVKGSSELIYIDFMNCNKISAAEIEHTISVCPALHSVNVGETAVTEDEVKVLRNMFSHIHFLVEANPTSLEVLVESLYY